MMKNVGGIDRFLRIAIGVVLLALAAAGQIGAWGYLGLVPLFTGITGRCLPYKLLGINTCPMKDQ